MSTIRDLEDVLSTLKGINLDAIPSGDLVPLIKAVQNIGAFATALDIEINRRAVDHGKLIPGVIVETAVTHRKWADTEAAEQLAREQFGDKAFKTSLKSPVEIEKLDGGKFFVSLCSVKPEGAKRAKY